MKTVLIIIFAVAAIICAIGWLCYWVSTAALIMYMIRKNYTLPTDPELKACMAEVVRNKFKINRRAD